MKPISWLNAARGHIVRRVIGRRRRNSRAREFEFGVDFIARGVIRGLGDR